MTITTATAEDLAAILALQYLAYQSEAKLVGNSDIPPLTQTLREVEAEYRAGVILKAVDEKGQIIGSVRGRVEDGTLLVGKLMVHPKCQGQGIGTALLREIEVVCPQPRCELFTSDKSAQNLRLYEGLGYRRFDEKEIVPGLRMIYLEKCVPTK